VPQCLTRRAPLRGAADSRGSTPGAGPSKREGGNFIKNHQNFRPQKSLFFYKKIALWDPIGHLKIKKLKSVPPWAHFLPLLIFIWNFNDFLTPWNPANGVLAYIKHRFSLFHPTPTMSSKWLPKTSHLGTFGHKVCDKVVKNGAPENTRKNKLQTITKKSQICLLNGVD